MLTSDDFVIIVPIKGLPRLAAAGEDLSPYIGTSFSRANKTVALKDGRAVQGSVFWAGARSAAAELQILELLNAQFASILPT